ncbi:MAG: STAS domain-containing protein [Planctomycetes bacterium]|nr:STAS domain-containing protein [Planctomycetota bacterium]
MQTTTGALVVFETGDTMLVGFRGAHVVDDALLEEFAAALERDLRQHRTRSLVVDLAGVKLVSSGVLGFLFSLHRKGLDVRLKNTGPAVQDVLRVTRLDCALRELESVAV